MAQLIKSNGGMAEVVPKNGRAFTLDELQGFVGGYIELVNLVDSYLVMNEDGRLNGLPKNERATAIAMNVGVISMFDYICGDVLICSINQIE